MHWNTVTPLLREVLEATMAEPLFDCFRLVGGTSLSLQIGHRLSVDIDLFSAADYDTINFKKIHQFFRDHYNYVETHIVENVGIGTSYYVGHSADEAIKVDVYYTEPFIRPEVIEENVRFCSIEDIIAMKLEIIGAVGRKKDFWDLHAVHDSFTVEQIISCYQEKYPYNYSNDEIRAGLVNFSLADDEPDPICLLGKHWELIKLDIVTWLG